MNIKQNKSNAEQARVNKSNAAIKQKREN